ncbi:MAG: hypothetical protein NTU53_09815, partial [Planctomycetota bacterium]|nr:hypothetical protein [Planctomycetota bacterium]
MKKLSIVVVVAMLLVTAGAANAAAIFEDNFDSPTLSPEWLISPGKGSYSLTDNPGHLRYIVDAWGWVGGVEALRFARPFSGDQWVLQAAVTYNLRPAEPTNNRNTYFRVRQPGADGASMVSMERGIGANDDNPNGTNTMQFYYGAVNGPRVIYPRSPGPVPPDRWYFEIERNKDYVVVGASTDGNDSTMPIRLTHLPPTGSGDSPKPVMLPLARVQLGVGGRLGAGRDAEQRTE